MKRGLRGICLLTTFTGVLFLVGCSHPPTKVANTWDQKAAAAYLDQREAWWTDWPLASRDHQTFCISCHTAVPYALSRPVLRGALGEKAPSINERRLINNIVKRVRLWKEVEPFYSDK